MHFVIKNPAPQEAGDARWGDQYFGEALEGALTEAGCTVRQDFWPDWDTDGESDVTLVLRGLRASHPPGGGFRILWIISHPAEVTADELDAYDLVLAASRIHARLLASITRTPVRVALQCTDEATFHPPEQSIQEQARTRQDLVYVANTRGVRREMGQWLLASGRAARIFGRAWEYCGLGHMVEAQHLANPDVGELYRHARIALNDHWLDMRGFGYVNNRLFDCLACGTPVITDDSPELRELFGDALYYVQSAEDFDNAIRDCEADYTATLERVARKWDEIRDRFTFRARAAELIAWAQHPPRERRPSAADVGRSVERRLEGLMRVNARYEAAHRAELSQQIRTLERTAEKRETELERTVSELEKNRHQLERAAEERDQAVRERERLSVSEEMARTARTRAEEAQAAAEAEARAARDALESQGRLAAVTLRYTERLERSLRAVLASASWRVTTPMRLFTGVMRLLLRGRRGAPIQAPKRPPELPQLQASVGQPDQLPSGPTHDEVSSSLGIDRRAPVRLYKRVRGIARAGVGHALHSMGARRSGTPKPRASSESSSPARPSGKAQSQTTGATEPDADTVYWRLQALQLLEELEYTRSRLDAFERDGTSAGAAPESLTEHGGHVG